MIVSVIGASGRTGRYITSHLFASGHGVTGLVRREDAVGEVTSLGRAPGPQAEGVQAVVVDLLGSEEDLAHAFAGSEVVVNAAGSYDPQATGASADREGAVAAIRTAQAAGVRRYVQVSSMFADRPAAGPEFLRAVLQAKHESDQALMSSGLDWTIVRPGGLVDTGLTGQVTVGSRLDPGSVSREDVAAVVASCVTMPRTIGFAFDLVTGAIPILRALDDLTAQDPEGGPLTPNS